MKNGVGRSIRNDDENSEDELELFLASPPANEEVKALPYSLSHGTVQSILACAMYSFCSVSMVLTNKSLASR